MDGTQPMDKLENWFTYHKPEDGQPEKYKAICEKALELARVIEASVPPGPDQTTAYRKLREAVMTANAGIACKGI